MRILLSVCFIFLFTAARAQTLGGNATYNFLKLPSSPLLTAAGGINASYKTNEVSLSANNPALLDETMHGQLNLSFNGFIAGIKTYGLTGALYKPAIKTTFNGHIYFVDYGTIPETDAAGNIMGNFRPVDFVVQAGAGRSYMDKWQYGASLKFIHSSYQQYRSGALAMDVGIHYSDTAHFFSAALLAKNMGVQLKTYNGEGEDLPFDLQVGITKRLAKAPIGFSFTAQQLQHFNVHYNDTAFNNENDFSSGKGFFNRMLDHVVVATHIYLGNNLEATVGYNRLRRSELNIGSSGNGLNGFSMGLRLRFQKLQVQYARSNYQRNIAYNQVGLTLHMDRLFGFGTL